MSWKNLGLPVQSLLFGTAVAITAWLLSLVGSQYSNVPRDAVGAQFGGRSPSGGEPYDRSGHRPGGRSDDDYAGRGLPGEGRRP
jgi:hypothetical protein